MSIAEKISKLYSELQPYKATLVAVTKNRSIQELEELYKTGHRLFGENRVQELVAKYHALPKDIEWHLIGHLQTNKVKYIAPFVHTIHSIDSLKLLAEVNKQALKNDRIVNCFFQIYIAKEESKFGLSEDEMNEILKSEEFANFKNIKITGLMGMATNTDDKILIQSEFANLKAIFDKLKATKSFNIDLKYLSMGMSGDYQIALEQGSNMVRIGSYIFS
jgi:pyridoxal phosphate enzyme (YggS family)